MVDRRWLRVASLAETLTLFVLLLNRFTVHLDPVTSLVGPFHGFAYLATIACGLLVPLRRSARALCGYPASVAGRPPGVATRTECSAGDVTGTELSDSPSLMVAALGRVVGRRLNDALAGLGLSLRSLGALRHLPASRTSPTPNSPAGPG